MEDRGALLRYGVSGLSNVSATLTNYVRNVLFTPNLTNIFPRVAMADLAVATPHAYDTLRVAVKEAWDAITELQLAQLLE